MALTWNDLFLSGSVISLSTSRWIARLRIRPVDLGIADSSAVSKALALGSHRLVPQEAFAKINEIRGNAMRSVEHYSLPFGFVFGARYVPAANLAKLGERLNELRGELDAAVDSFVEGYETTKQEMLPVIEQALQDAARTPEAAAIAMARVRSEYPTAETVRGKFGLTWSVYAIQGPKTAGAETALASEAEIVRGVIADMVGQLREEVTTKLADVLALIQRGGSLKPVSIAAAKAVLDRVESVNILGDATLAFQVKQLRSALNGIEAGQRIPDSAVAGLEGIKAALETNLDDAVKAAELNLTKVGRRRLAVA